MLEHMLLVTHALTYVYACVTCQARRTRNEEASLLEMEVHVYPFEMVNIHVDQDIEREYLYSEFCGLAQKLGGSLCCREQNSPVNERQTHYYLPASFPK